MGDNKRASYNSLKAKADAMFKEQNYRGASEGYTEALKEALGEEKIVLHNNRAACHLKLKQYYHAIDDCNEALLFNDVMNSLSLCKSYYRRAVARRDLSCFKMARDDFMKVLSFEPDNKPSSNEVDKLNRVLEQDIRTVVDTIDKPERFRSTKPMQRFQLNNQYSGVKKYNLKA